MRAPRVFMLFPLVLVPLAASAQPASSLDKSSGGSVPALSLSKGQAYPARPVRVLIPFTPWRWPGAPLYRDRGDPNS